MRELEAETRTIQPSPGGFRAFYCPDEEFRIASVSVLGLSLTIPTRPKFAPTLCDHATSVGHFLRSRSTLRLYRPFRDPKIQHTPFRHMRKLSAQKFVSPPLFQFKYCKLNHSRSEK